MINPVLLEILKEKASIESSLEFIEKLLSSYPWSQDRIRTINESLSVIRNRQNTKKLHLGIVGEFSSGKSTLINSLLKEDFLKTDAVQGTTTIPTVFQYSSTIDFDIVYRNGSHLRFSKQKRTIKKRFPKYFLELHNLSFFERLTLPLRKNRIYRELSDRDKLRNLIQYITTSDQHSQKIKEVVIYYPADFLKSGVDIIDTPGTDSMNKTHLTTTKEVIEKSCDLALVVIPSEKPSSESLMEFLEQYLGENIHRCIFILTKVELLNREKERNLVTRTVSRRLGSKLDFPAPKVFKGPTLLDLEENGAIQRTGILDGLSVQEKHDLLDEYEEAKREIFRGLEENKFLIQLERLAILMSRLFSTLENELRVFEKKFMEEDNALRQNRITNLAEFSNEQKAVHQDRLLNNTAHCYDNISIACERKRDVLIDLVQRKIEAQKSKSDVRDFLENRLKPLVKDNVGSLDQTLKDQIKIVTSELSKQKRTFENEFQNMYKSLATLRGQIKVSDQQFVSAMKRDLGEIHLGSFSTDVAGIVNNAIQSHNISTAASGVTAAAIGTIIAPGIGTIIGGVLGALIGSLFGPSTEKVKAEVKRKIANELDYTFDEVRDVFVSIFDQVQKDVIHNFEQMIDSYMTKYNQLVETMIARNKAQKIKLENLRRQTQNDLRQLESQINRFNALKSEMKNL